MWNPEIDCKYFNKCGKCLKVSACPILKSLAKKKIKEFDRQPVRVLGVWIPSDKEFDNLKKEQKCFMCADSACCSFAQECCIPAREYNA